MRKLYTFPRMGIYTDYLCNLVRGLGREVVKPPEITKETIKLGVKYSPEMICFPYKVCIGNLIQSLEAGANKIIWVDTQGTCRFTHFSDIQTKVLKDLGYEFDLISIRTKKILTDFRKINPELSYPTLLRKIRKYYTILKGLDEQFYGFEKKEGIINIGIIGEIYTIHEPAINHNIVQLLKSMDVNVDVAFKMSDFIKKSLHLDFSRKIEKKESKELLGKGIGGHARESLYNALYYAKNGFDGIIHLMPLTCMPETTIQPLLEMISKKYGIPIYSFPIDENNSEAGFKTRLETFVSILKQKKMVKCTI